MSHDILTSILVDLLAELKQRVGVKSQFQLAEHADIDKSLVSKYHRQLMWPADNLDELARVAKLTTGQMGWLIGFLLERRYHAHRFERLDVADEPAEPAFDEPSLEERLEVAMTLDLSSLPLDERVALARARDALRKTIGRFLDTQRGLTEDLESQLEVLHDNHRAAVQRNTD